MTSPTVPPAAMKGCQIHGDSGCPRLEDIEQGIVFGFPGTS